MDADAAETLVRRCQQTLPDDTRAFELLVQAFSSRIYASAYRLMGNHHDADEMAQEVFIKVYHGIGDLADPATFLSWLYRITTNTCLDNLDRRQRRPQTTSLAPETGDGAEEVYADQRTPSPEDAALQRELRRCIERTLARLESTERAMIVLRDVEGQAYQEIAEALSLGLSAVKMRIHRARLAFGQLLETICPEAWHTHGPALAATLPRSPRTPQEVRV